MNSTLRRRGHSLTEMLVVMTVSGVLLSLFGVSLHGMFRAQQRTRGDHVFEDSLARFSRQFRGDAHRANVSALSDDALGIRLTPAGNTTIEYRFDREQITRVVSAGDQIRHRDAFVLPPGYAVRFSQAPDPPRLIVEVHSPIEAGIRGIEPAVRRIETTVGLN